MSKKQFLEVASAVVTAVAAVLVAFGVLTFDGVDGVAAGNEPSARGTSHFSSLSVSGDQTLTGVLQVDEIDNAQTGAQSLAPAASFYEFNPTSTLTLTLTNTNAAVGDLLILQNVNGSNNVVLVDTGATIGGGNITLGANDTALLVYSNGKWVMVATADNS